jgi:aspartate kinase
MSGKPDKGATSITQRPLQDAQRSDRGDSTMTTRHPTAGQAVPPPLVWKFGGSSVKDHDRIRAVARRLVDAHRRGHRVVAVLSAMGRTTDELVQMAYAMTARPPLREFDALLAVGESISCALTAMAVDELGVSAVSFTGRQAGMLTDARHGSSRLVDLRPDRIVAALDHGAIVLVTGFQGVSDDGDVTTLGRGGSDASAVAVAAALGARECEIFTDTPAVCTADPRVVAGAQRIARLRPEEMLELAEAGAGVLQPRSVELAIAHDIAIHLRSSFTDEEGTRIRRAQPGEIESSRVVGVAHRRREDLYTVRGESAAAVVAALADRGIAPGVLLPDAGAVRFSAPGADAADVAAATAGAGVDAETGELLGTVSVVSLGIGRRPAVAARMLAALDGAGIPVRLVTSTPARVTAHVPTAEIDAAVRLLHDTFIPGEAVKETCDVA